MTINNLNAASLTSAYKPQVASRSNQATTSGLRMKQPIQKDTIHFSGSGASKLAKEMEKAEIEKNAILKSPNTSQAEKDEARRKYREAKEAYEERTTSSNPGGIDEGGWAGR